MPTEVDTDALAKKTSIDLGNPPLRQIPIQEYPRMVYKWPKVPLRVSRKQFAGEWIETQVPTEHLVKTVENDKELAKALKEGWRKEAYVPKDLPSHETEMYDVYEEPKPSAGPITQPPTGPVPPKV